MAVAAAHYLKIVTSSGSMVEGESYGHNLAGEGLRHVNEIDVKGWDWHVADRTAAADPETDKSAKGGSALSEGKDAGIEVGVLTFRKSVDKSSTRLMNALKTGDKFALATFVLLEEVVDVHNQRGGAFRLNVVLENPVVVSYTLNANSSEHRVDLEEVWDLSFSKITFAYESAGVYVDFDQTSGSSQRRKDVPGKKALESLLKEYGIQPERRTRGKRE